MRLRPVLALGLVTVMLAGAGVGAELGRRDFERTVPHGPSAARGVRVEGRAIPGDVDARAFVEAIAAEELDRPIEVRYDDEALFTVTARELGARADADWVVARALSIGREGDLYDRYVEAKATAEQGVDLRLPVSLGTDVLAVRLRDLKDELDARPAPARRHIGTGTVDEHEDGRYIDAFAASETLLVAVHEGKTTVDLTPYRLTPAATADAVRAADVSTVVSSFETRFGGPPGRDQNIYRAAGLLDGIVLMPHDEVSYNAVVGPRSIDNGFAYAPEIYKGEMREGVGGGACQVASTLHAAAFFGGLEVLERRNHSRMSGYIRAGLDATVSYPVLDLKIRNPYDFPVVIHASAEKGTLKFEILGRDRPVVVDLATETSGVFNYTRKIEKSSFVPEGEVRVKQRGKNGMSLKRKKTIRTKSGDVKVEESTDVFPSMQEILLVGPKFDESTLPPLPSAAASLTSTLAAPANG